MANAGHVFLAIIHYVLYYYKAIDGKFHKGNRTCLTTQWLLLLFWLFTIELCFCLLGLQEN